MNRTVKVSAICTCYKNGEKFMPDFFASAASSTIKDQLEVVLVHYNPNDTERKMVADFQEKHPGLLTYVEGPAENVASAMNRGVKVANGEYICIWNIDDLRTPESFELESKVLDEHPEIHFTYGDFIMVNAWLKQTGRNITLPEYDKREFIRSMPLGPFYMWRKNVHEKIGYFDEQFYSATDFDFSARLSTQYNGMKCPGQLGYYLDIGGGISTAKGSLPKVERTVVELRYGSYRKVDFIYISKTKKYDFEKVLNFGEWKELNQLAPNRYKYMDSKLMWGYNVIRYPFAFIQRVINKLTRMFYSKYR